MLYELRFAYIGGRVVAEIVENDREGVDDDAQYVAPSPLKLGVEIQSARNWWTENSEGD
jgi:hypothetical protein